MYINDLKECFKNGAITQQEYDEIFQSMSICEDREQLIGLVPNTKGMIKFNLNGDMVDGSLMEFLKTRIEPPYEAEHIDPLFKKYGMMVCGIADYWHWFTKDNITQYALENGHKPIEEATDEELWKMIAICSRYWQVFYEREYRRTKQRS